MATNYFLVEFHLTENQQQKIQSAIKNSHDCTLRINPLIKGKSKLYITQTQLNKLNKGIKNNKSVDITFSKEQLKHQTGGFLPIIGALAAKFLPLIVKGALAGAASSAASKVVNKITGKGTRIIGKKYDGEGTRIMGKQYGNGSKNV